MTGRALNLFVALWLGCLLCAILAVWAATADAPGQCIPLAQALFQSKLAVYRGQGDMGLLTEAQTVRYLAVVNASEPPTDWAGEHLLWQGGDVVAVAVTHGFVVCLMGRIPGAMHAKAMRIALGLGV